jgi:hypothetical protein
MPVTIIVQERTLSPLSMSSQQSQSPAIESTAPSAGRAGQLRPARHRSCDCVLITYIL